MAVNPVTTVRKLISLPRELVSKISDYRFDRRIKTEAEAIRQLIERGLPRKNGGKYAKDRT